MFKKLFLALVLLTGFFLPVKAHTLSTLNTEIRLRIRDTSSNTSRQRYTDTQITNIINESQRDIINNTWAIEKISTFTTVIGTTYYAYPSDLIVPSRVTANSISIPEVSLITLDSLYENANWQTVTGIPRYYFIDRAQTNKIGIFPFPSVVTSTQSINMHYYAFPTDLSGSSDVPFDSLSYLYPYHDLIIFYSCYRIFLIEGETDKLTAYRGEYEARLKLMNDLVGKKPNFIPGMAGPANSR